MRSHLLGAILGALFVVTAAPALAQEEGGEVVVTGFRALSRDDDDNDKLKALILTPPAAVQTLRRTADFAVQQVIIVSDTTDDDEAEAEIFAMTRKAIERSAGAGTLLATGEMLVEPLTVSNYKELKVDDDQVKFLVKVPLAPGIDAKAALAKIDKFIKAVPPVGRAEMKAYSELTLSVVNPEQYRGAIIDLVARDTTTTSARFGGGYGVEVTGLDRPVQWQRAGLTEVQLYLPSNATVRPRN
jgi:hypothetical protein